MLLMALSDEKVIFYDVNVCTAYSQICIVKLGLTTSQASSMLKCYGSVKTLMPQEQGVKKKASHIILSVLLNKANPNLHYEKSCFSFLSCLPHLQ